MHHAAAAGHESVVRVFVDYAHSANSSNPQSAFEGPRGWGSQVDLNLLDWEGNSPLHLACQIANQEIACRLLFAGAGMTSSFLLLLVLYFIAYYWH